MTPEQLNALPKLDLHCHLDGSLAPTFIQQVVSHTNPQPLEALLPQLQVGANCQSLADYLKCFDLAEACMQTAQNIEAGAYAYVKSLTNEHVIYAEARYSPALFANPELTQRQALEATLAGLRRGREDFGITVNSIICALRHAPFAENSAVFRLASEYKDAGVCALDLACDEAAFPTHLFGDLFNLAKSLDMDFTIHAGECGSAQSIVDALDFGAKRIGHGIAMRGHKDLQARCARDSIGIEMCPISNYQTKALQPGDMYPLQEFLQAGVLATVNTDNRTVSNTTLGQEFAFLQEKFQFTDEDIRTVTNNAITVAFTTDDVKHQLWKIVNG